MNMVKSGKQQKQRFSIQYKIMIAVALLMVLTVTVLNVSSIKLAKKAVEEKVEKHLIDNAKNTAKIVDLSIEADFVHLQTIARMSMMKNLEIPYAEKAKRLNKEADLMKTFNLYIADAKGTLYLENGAKSYVGDRSFYKKAMNGITNITEPYKDRITGELVISVCTPIYDDQKNVISAIIADYPGLELLKYIKDIVVGETGYCYIVGETGTTIAHKKENRVMEKENLIEMAKTDETHKSNAELIQKAMNSEKPAVGFYEHLGTSNIAAFAKIKTTGWTVIVKAPIHEFMGTVGELIKLITIAGVIIGLLVLAIISFLIYRMLKPLKITVNALKNISQGEGDLTVRLDVKGNDEMTDLSLYFNQTIEKINHSMSSVLNTSEDMKKIGETLSSNMTETASSINQISANIEGVKGQVIDQSSGVTETSATMEEIIRTIHSLDERIANQVQSLQELMQIIKDSDATTAETRNILDENDALIADLVSESSEGKEVISESAEEVKNILDESGSLMEASNIIQNIASQTNLLAMNAAIEAAHAGDAGKGFAVVADEIRKLAEESSSQAKVITAALKNLSTEIEMVSKSSNNIGESFMSIFDKVNQVKARSAGIMEIAKTRKEQSDKLLGLVQNVDGITTEVKDGSAEMLRGGEQVATEMRKLDELTRIITDSMNEMAAGATQINNAVQEVNDLSQDNKESIKILSEEVNKFKV